MADWDNSDPTADFLAREQAILGAEAAVFAYSTSSADALVEEEPEFVKREREAGLLSTPLASAHAPVASLYFSNNNLFDADNASPAASFVAAPPVVDFNNNNGFGDFSGSAPQQQQIYVDNSTNFQASFPEVPNNVFGGSMGVGYQTSSFQNVSIVPLEAEPIRKWKEDYKLAIEERDRKSAEKHSKILATAKDSLDRFYADYNDKKNKSIIRNKDAESAMHEVKEKANLAGNVWERSVKLIETNTSAVGTSTKKDVSKESKKKDEKEKDTEKLKAKDTTRMKSLLYNLKADPKAPGLTV